MILSSILMSMTALSCLLKLDCCGFRSTLAAIRRIEHAFHLKIDAHQRGARPTPAGTAGLASVRTTSLPSWVPHDGVSRARLPSNICHRGNSEDKPQLIRTCGPTLRRRFRRGAFGVRTHATTVLRAAFRGCTGLHSLTPLPTSIARCASHRHRFER
jgi:hypothetical protein